MRMFAFLSLAIMFLSIYSNPYNEEINSSNKVQAINFLMYRDTVRKYVFQNKITSSGVIEDKDIEFPTGFINKAWNATIQDNILYIYGKASQQEINQVKKQTYYSHSIGQKQNGLFYPHYTTPPIILPKFIQEGNLVSIMEIVE